MAELVTCRRPAVKIADAGAGSGILGISVCEYLTRVNKGLKVIELTAYEADPGCIPHLTQSLNFAKQWLRERGIGLKFDILNADFVLSNADALNNQGTLVAAASHRFNIIISNPPYFKLRKSDPRARAAGRVVHGQPNIYALFMAISAHLLYASGEMVFITPRSYAAGPYFKRFREHFFAVVSPTFIHLFGSRDKAFDKDDVLQENIILRAKPRNGYDPLQSPEHLVTISYSTGLSDLTASRHRSVPVSEIIDLHTRHRVLRIPVTPREDRIIKLVHAWKGSLSDYGMKISTGPVVPFRANGFLADKETDDGLCVPLLWMQNVTPMSTVWPAKTQKHQYIRNSGSATGLLVANKNYVLLRRFSTKDDRRRLIAAPYLVSTPRPGVIGIENHLNYIYRPQRELSPEEAFGLAALLNSELLDTYFRTSNGNTQVSATEIKNLPLPKLSVIRKIGSILLKTSLGCNQLDEIIREAMGAAYSLPYEQNRGGSGNPEIIQNDVSGYRKRPLNRVVGQDS